MWDMLVPCRVYAGMLKHAEMWTCYMFCFFFLVDILFNWKNTCQILPWRLALDMLRPMYIANIQSTTNSALHREVQPTTISKVILSLQLWLLEPHPEFWKKNPFFASEKKHENGVRCINQQTWWAYKETTEKQSVKRDDCKITHPKLQIKMTHITWVSPSLSISILYTYMCTTFPHLFLQFLGCNFCSLKIQPCKRFSPDISQLQMSIKQWKVNKKIQKVGKLLLVGGFDPFVWIGSFPQIGVKIEKIETTT